MEKANINMNLNPKGQLHIDCQHDLLFEYVMTKL